MADIADIIEAAAARHGVSPEALIAIAQIESNMNPRAQNPYSSAGGLFQFTNIGAKEYGLTGNSRMDAERAADAAARMAQDNTERLKGVLGRDPTPGELYLAHQQGPGGASALLRDPNRNVVDALATVYGGSRGKAAEAVRQNGGNTSMTAGQFASLWVNRGDATARLVPPSSIPQVATALDVIERVAPTPQTRPASLMGYAPLPEKSPVPAPRPTVARPSGSALGDSIALSPIPGGREAQQAFDAAYDTRLGAMRETYSPITGWGIDYAASPAPRPKVSASDKARGRSAPPPAQRPQVSASDMARGRSLPRPVAPIPSRPSAESQSLTAKGYGDLLSMLDTPAPIPAPVPATQSLPLSSSRAAAGVVDVGLQRALEAQAKSPAVNQPVTASDRARAAQRPPQAPGAMVPGPAPAPKIEDRLVTAGLPPANYGVINQPAPAVATQLSTTPPALPSTPTAYSPPGVAPVPMPRLDRPGMFGNPMIGNWKVPLPGALGIAQNFTKAMANASGPFNNGLENLLYNTMRGGDFNTPGAAVAQAGGYLYAPNGKGGLINVGRVNPNVSAADDYEARSAAARRSPHSALNTRYASNDGGSGGVQPKGTIF